MSQAVEVRKAPSPQFNTFCFFVVSDVTWLEVTNQQKLFTRQTVWKSMNNGVTTGLYFFVSRFMLVGMLCAHGHALRLCIVFRSLPG